MKFCDKLAKQRKNNNLSQEQLADSLGVSRQAVSKWESGQSYPDMEKMIQMTKILNCTLEDLLDDGTINNNHITNKMNFNSYLHDLLKFITKSYNMFCSMTFKEKIKCIFEMFIVFLLLLITSAIIESTINYLILFWFDKIPVIGYEIRNVLNTLVTIALLILGIIIFLHLFKIRYLDYFITVEDENVIEKTIEQSVEKKENKYYQEDKKEKIIIRDPKHSSLSFYNFFLKMIIFIIKIFTIIFIVPIIGFFVCAFIVGIMSLVNINYGAIFLFIFLICLAIGILCYVVMYFVYNFIFNKEIKFKLMFNIIIVGLVLLGTSTGLTIITALNYKYVDNLDNLKTITKTEYIKINNNTEINSYATDNDIEYIIDNNEENARVEITYLKNADYKIHHDSDENNDYYYIYSSGMDFNELRDTIKTDLKNKTFRNYETSANFKVKIYVSQTNYDILKNNFND